MSLPAMIYPHVHKNQHVDRIDIINGPVTVSPDPEWVQGQRLVVDKTVIHDAIILDRQHGRWTKFRSYTVLGEYEHPLDERTMRMILSARRNGQEEGFVSGQNHKAEMMRRILGI